MPRCRAIMCPGRTTSPFPRFNPKYFALESRPLLDEPPCFFDANLAKTALTLAFQHFNPSLDALGPAPRLTSARTDDAIARPEPLVGARESMEIQPITRRRTPIRVNHARARAHAHTTRSRPRAHPSSDGVSRECGRRRLGPDAWVGARSDIRRTSPQGHRPTRVRSLHSVTSHTTMIASHPCGFDKITWHTQTTDRDQGGAPPRRPWISKSNFGRSTVVRRVSGIADAIHARAAAAANARTHTERTEHARCKFLSRRSPGRPSRSRSRARIPSITSRRRFKTRKVRGTIDRSTSRDDLRIMRRDGSERESVRALAGWNDGRGDG